MLDKLAHLLSEDVFRKSLIGFSVILLFIVGFSLLYFLLSIYPPKMGVERNPSQLGYDYENVEFETEDGLTLAGWFIPSNESDAVIIVGHGYPFSKSNVLHLSRFLYPEYNLLFFDFRSFGDSEGRHTTVGHKERKDFRSAVEYLKIREDINPEKIGALGFSLSASVMIMAETDVKAIVAESPYANLNLLLEDVYKMFPGFTKKPFVWLTNLYGILFIGSNPKDVSPMDSIADLEVPVLLIHGEKDSEIPIKHSELIYENSNKNLTEFWRVEGSGHGMTYSLKGKEYERRIIEFFNAHLD